MDARNAELEHLQGRLEGEADEEQQRLASELAELHDSKGALQKKLDKEADKTGQMQRQNWWLTALQLRVKKIVMEKVEKEKRAADELRRELEENSREQQ